MTPRAQVSPVLLLGFAGALAAWPGEGLAQGLFRKKADREVQEVLEEKAGKARWDVNPEVIEADARSRYHDPHDPDHPLKPEDDPASAELMRRVDGKFGALSWASGEAPSPVESGAWKQFLPLDGSGRVKLNLNNTVALALLHSRSLQRAREELYLSALDVTEQRFRFDGKPVFFHDSSRVATGKDRPGGNVQTHLAGSELEVKQHFATGADFVLSLANSLFWDLTKDGLVPDVSSLIDVAISQPLLKYRARAFVLEDLTQAERTLLANVRRMKQYQQAFYIDVISGRNVNSGPARSQAGASVAPIIAGLPGSAITGGYLGLLQTRQQIRNQESSVAALRDSLAQLQAAFDAGRISNRLQVDQANQALFNGQNRLLTARASYESAVDTYKVNLGLPPDLNVIVDDQLLEQFNLVDPDMSGLQSDVADLLDGLRRKSAGESVEVLKDLTVRGGAFTPRVQAQVERGWRDLERLRGQIPRRREQMERLRTSPEINDIDVDPQLLGAEVLEQLDKRLESNLKEVERRAEATMKGLQALAEVTPPEEALDRARNNVVGTITDLSGLLLELSLIQAASRLEAVVLSPVELSYDDALRLATDYRLDWMNARARLVDAWRQVAVDAEALKMGLNLIVNGKIPTVGNSAEDFSREVSRFDFGLEMNLPWRRVAERNHYKETLIGYQRARRDFMLFEDDARRSLRNTLRIVALSQISFEVRRAALRMAVTQVDLARLRLNEPPRPGAAGTQFGATTARDLISALSDLLSGQNDFLQLWVSYEVLRVLLDYELGTMVLDEQGVWRDPGIVTAAHLEARLKGDEQKESGKTVSESAVIDRASLGREPAGGGVAGSGGKKRVLGIYRKY